MDTNNIYHVVSTLTVKSFTATACKFNKIYYFSVMSKRFITFNQEYLVASLTCMTTCTCEVKNISKKKHIIDLCVLTLLVPHVQFFWNLEFFFWSLTNIRKLLLLITTRFQLRDHMFFHRVTDFLKKYPFPPLK